MELGTWIGRMLAKRPSAFRSASRPSSGRFGALSHFGPPIAPSKMASASRHAFKVEEGIGSCATSIPAPPKG